MRACVRACVLLGPAWSRNAPHCAQYDPTVVEFIVAYVPMMLLLGSACYFVTKRVFPEWFPMAPHRRRIPVNAAAAAAEGKSD